MLNYSNFHALDLVWPEKFFLRRLTLMTLAEWKFVFHADSFQPWCLPPKLSVRIGRVSLSLMFHEAWWLPEIDAWVSIPKRFRGEQFRFAIYWRRWKDNFRTIFNNQTSYNG